MTTESETALAGLGAEPGFEADQPVESARVSGFAALVFGLLSVISFMGIPLLVLPLLAVVLGMFALRRCEGRAPLGTGAAKIGLILAVGFGACGVAVPYLRTLTLGGQAERFSLAYLNLIANGNDMLARELTRSYPNQLPATMSLEDYYASNPNAQRQLTVFHQLPLNVWIRQFGPDADWQLEQPVRVDYHFGREQVEVVWRQPNGDGRVQFFMEFQLGSDGVGQWHVETCQRFRELVVAETVL